MSFVVPIDPGQLHNSTEGGRPKRPPLSVYQRWLLAVASLLSAGSALWPAMDALYQGAFRPVAFWWVLVFAAGCAWVAFINRGGQEKIMRRQDALESYLSMVHNYHADLGEKLDKWGDEREINGHRITSDALRANGHRHLSVVEGD